MISKTCFNGKPATADDLAPLAFAGYAHFTAMQLRDRAVRGLDLHLDRLRNASDELFGCHLPDKKIRELLSSAVTSTPPDVTLTVFVSSRPGEFMRTHGKVELDVLTRVTDPVMPSAEPPTLDVVMHSRHLPHVKHVGEVAKTQFLRRANKRGFDDAIFADASGYLSEATIWNLAFWDGRSLIWPKADVLPGITMQIVKRQLSARNIKQVSRRIRTADLTEDLAGAVMNSSNPGIPIARIGDFPLRGQSDELTRILHEAYASEIPITL
ncbi:aminotransferase class IV [Pseudarthrobacter sp. NamE5]|uniref:aminotransferase class IV n=1 Tax=Pseudarthrobacter sp. NamE5 TaxID=2576839 RepID=UPI00110BF7A7|nr:aminotransferase class IV [Pseudarthrobacter sp. NamE5]TLM80921.1 branched-chain amino acid aminotransferase [Pseudarthrobacter sp. NamE5]